MLERLLDALAHAVRLSDEEPDNNRRLRDVRLVARDLVYWSQHQTSVCEVAP